MQRNKGNLIFKRLAGLKGKWALLLLLVLAIVCLVYGSAATQKKAEDTAAHDLQRAEEYREHLEKELTLLLGQVKGVGRVRVFLTLSECEEYVYAENQSASGKNYATMGGDALLLSVRMPKVAGVAVLCDGANDAAVQASLVSLLSAALDIPSHHIAISPLKKE